MNHTIKLMADYQCFPIWHSGGEVGNIDPKELAVTGELRAALYAWAERFDRTLNPDNPAQSGFANSADEDSFDREGRRLWGLLQEQLSEYRVLYFSQKDGTLYAPEPLSR